MNATSSTSPNSSRDSSEYAAGKQSDKYKVVIEAVQEKRPSMKPVFTLDQRAPAGYVFVPAGYPQLTLWCKNLCKLRNLQIYVVSDKNQFSGDPSRVTHHVHRSGYHFPTVVVKSACEDRDFVVSNGTVKWNPDGMSKRKKQKQGVKSVRNPDVNIDKNTTANAIRDLFPYIPVHDAYYIARHAFREGSTRVGTCTQLTLARRAQLAVLAHVRHVYTNYDALLKIYPYEKVRAMIEKPCLETIRKWRGEDDITSDEIEETFREIIVLDDDDEGQDAGVDAEKEEESGVAGLEDVQRALPTRDVSSLAQGEDSSLPKASSGVGTDSTAPSNVQAEPEHSSKFIFRGTPNDTSRLPETYSQWKFSFGKRYATDKRISSNTESVQQGRSQPSTSNYIDLTTDDTFEAQRRRLWVRPRALQQQQSSSGQRFHGPQPARFRIARPARSSVGSYPASSPPAFSSAPVSSLRFVRAIPHRTRSDMIVRPTAFRARRWEYRGRYG